MNVPEIKPGEFNPDEYELIDVRTPEEFTGELAHIQGSKLITIGEDLDTALESYSKDTKIIFVCRSGNRSGVATLKALKMGFSEVYNMTGGMILWNALSLDTET